MQMTSNEALFEDSVNTQQISRAHFRGLFGVAKPDNPPYCWGALRDEVNSRQIAKTFNRQNQ
jgi:hypothetical protein